MEELRGGDVDEEEELVIPLYLTLAARRINGRRGKLPRRNLTQYHDFASSALEVQISLHKDGDPFMDSEEHPLVRLCAFRNVML